MKNRIKIISLSANEKMANDIAKLLDAKLIERDLIHFADGEIMFEGKETFRGDNVYIIQSTCTPVNERLMEVLICADACKRGSAKSVTCIMPYYGYSRQDRKAKPRQPITAKLVADLLTTAGVDKMVCVDLHAAQIQGFFNIPLDNTTAMYLFYPYLKHLNLENPVCVSPDHGGVVRTSKLAKKLNCPIAIIDKRRPEPNKAEILAIVGDVKDKTCIIVDDIVDTAGTLCAAANKLKELGAKAVYATITHGILSGSAIDKINDSAIEKLIITDSIPLREGIDARKIEVLSLAPILSRTINALEEGLSLGDTYKNYEEESI